jgi:alpha-tubulin suppressor-like RCC1 family protein
MKKITILLLLFFGSICTYKAKAQGIPKQINIVTFNVKNKMPSDVSSWGTTPGGLYLVVQKIPQANIGGPKLVVQIKQNGSKICGNSVDNGTETVVTGTKNYSANELLGSIGQCTPLKAGSYTLCVQFFNVDKFAISEEKCRDFTVENETQAALSYSPPQNITPENNKSLKTAETKAPLTFRWTPIVPKPQEPVTYRLRVWQLMQGQSGTQAMKTNTPVVQKDVKGITQFVKPNLMGDIEMLEGKADLVWSVQALDEKVTVLGMSDATKFGIEKIIKTDTCTWKMVDGGSLYNVAIRADSSLWWFKHFASGLDNQLTPATFEHPKLISSNKDWSSISAGIWHFYALKKDGTLWTMGKNIYGTIGDGTFSDKPTLTQIGNSNDWKIISTNYNHTLAIKTNGSLWCWGNNSSYQLSNVVAQYSSMSTPIQIGTDLDWKIICAGSSSSFAIKQDGTLWAWGFNGYGQLGDGTIANKQFPTKIGNSLWKKISSNGNTTFAIKNDGTLWAWGKNTIGQFGNNTTLSSNSPLQIGTFNTWKEIDSDGEYAIALKTDNSLWAWGKNNYGKIGDNSTVTKKIPTQIASATGWRYTSTCQYHSTAIDSNGKILVWGFSTRTSSGSNGSMVLTPKNIQCEINY